MRFLSFFIIFCVVVGLLIWLTSQKKLFCQGIGSWRVKIHVHWSDPNSFSWQCSSIKWLRKHLMLRCVIWYKPRWSLIFRIPQLTFINRYCSCSSLAMSSILGLAIVIENLINYFCDAATLAALMISKCHTYREEFSTSKNRLWIWLRRTIVANSVYYMAI